MTDWITKANEKIDKIEASQEVSSTCVSNTRKLVKDLYNLGIKPYRILVSADKEIAILFRTKTGNKATVEVDDSEDGTLLLSTKECYEGPVWEILSKLLSFSFGEET